MRPIYETQRGARLLTPLSRLAGRGEGVRVLGTPYLSPLTPIPSPPKRGRGEQGAKRYSFVVRSGSIKTMLTARGWWLLTFVIFLLAMGAVLALRGPATMLLIGLALFLWFTWEWTAFTVQVLGARNLAIHRTMQDERGKVSTFWAGRNFRVSLRARLVGRIPLTCVRFSDRTPGERDPAEGAAVWSGALAPGDEATWSYRLQ